MQISRLARTFAASIWNIGTYCIVQRLYLCKCADSPEPFAASIWNIGTYCIVQWLYLCKCADSPEPFAASIWKIGTYGIVQWPYLCKCADSPEPSLPAYEKLVLIALSSDYTCANVQTHQSLRCQHMKYWYLLHCPVTIPVQMCRLTRAFAASIWNIGTYCIVRWLYLCKCADSTESMLLGWISHKSPFQAAH